MVSVYEGGAGVYVYVYICVCVLCMRLKVLQLTFSSRREGKGGLFIYFFFFRVMGNNGMGWAPPRLLSWLDGWWERAMWGNTVWTSTPSLAIPAALFGFGLRGPFTPRRDGKWLLRANGRFFAVAFVTSPTLLEGKARGRGSSLSHTHRPGQQSKQSSQPQAIGKAVRKAGEMSA